MTQLQILYQGTVRFVEVKFYFRATVAGTQESLALGSMYSLADEHLRAYTHGALNVFEYEGENSPLVVIKVDTILSAVAMVPFKQDEGGRQFFLVEKCALGVIDSTTSLDLEQ